MPRRNRRRKFFIDKRVQGMWALINLIVAGLIVSLVGLELLRSFYVQFGWPLAGRPFEISDFLFILKLIIMIIIGGSLFWILSAYASHRIAGPIYRLNKSMLEVTNGNYNLRIKFRKKDYFQELATSFNRMLDSIENKFRAQQELINKVKELLPSLPQDHPKVKELVEILGGGEHDKGGGKEADKGTEGSYKLS